MSNFIINKPIIKKNQVSKCQIQSYIILNSTVKIQQSNFLYCKNYALLGQNIFFTRINFFLFFKHIQSCLIKILECIRNSRKKSMPKMKDLSQNQNDLHIQFGQKDILKTLKQFNNIQSCIKRQNYEDQINLQKRLSQKAQKTEVQKAINLTKLLVIEIEQIKSRFLQNQNNSKNHDSRVKQIQNSIIKLSQSINNCQQNIFNVQKAYQVTQQKINKLQSSIVQVKKHYNDKRFLIDKSEIKRQNQFKQNRYSEISEQQLIIKDVNQNIVELRRQIENIKGQKSIFNADMQTVKHNTLLLQGKINKYQDHRQNEFNSKLKKLNQKIIHENDRILQKTLANYQNSFVQKAQFSKFNSKIDSLINKLNQNLIKIQNSTSNKIQIIQSNIEQLKINSQINHQSLTNKFNDFTQQISKKHQNQKAMMIKSLNKYVKTQNMKKYFQEQHQKVYKIINSNFQQQKLVNQTICSENILARWLWQGQQLKAGNLISWDKQVINTLPQNFTLTNCGQKNNNTIIQISNSGIYKFQLGFYAKKKPTIQILINGKIIVSAVNSSSYVIHHSSGKLKSIQATQISGLSMVDFFLIPQKSRIAIAYTGDIKGQGFINIHRL